jgi:hypothetical protein
VTLIAETGRQRNLNNRFAGSGQLVAGILDAQLADIIPNGAAVLLTKRLRQMDRVNANSMCNLGQREVFSKTRGD